MCKSRRWTIRSRWPWRRCRTCPWRGRSRWCASASRRGPSAGRAGSRRSACSWSRRLCCPRLPCQCRRRRRRHRRPTLPARRRSADNPCGRRPGRWQRPRPRSRSRHRRPCCSSSPRGSRGSTPASAAVTAPPRGEDKYTRLSDFEVRGWFWRLVFRRRKMVNLFFAVFAYAGASFLWQLFWGVCWVSFLFFCNRRLLYRPSWMMYVWSVLPTVRQDKQLYVYNEVKNLAFVMQFQPWFLDGKAVYLYRLYYRCQYFEIFFFLDNTNLVVKNNASIMLLWCTWW